MKYMTQGMNTLQNDEVGLPPLNLSQEKLFRVMRMVKRQNLRDDFALSQSAKRDLNKSVEGSAASNLEADNLDIGDLYAEMVGQDRHEKPVKITSDQMANCSPLKNDKLTRDHIIPFKHLNNKTYFKTLEHMLQNNGNTTHRRF